jgi:hypothetical protein
MAMFTAYFDASGHPDMPNPMWVCGLVSTVDKWLKFEEKWKSLLAYFDIENPFHMTDFMAGEKQYKSWAHDKTTRDEFQLKAIKLINKYTLKDVALGTNVPDFYRFHREYVIPPNSPGELLSKPFAYCAMGAFLEVQAWAFNYATKKQKRPEQIFRETEYVYDRKDKHRGQFATALRKTFGRDPIPRSKVEAVPLQAADMLAWRLANAAKEMVAPYETARGPHDALLEAIRTLPGSSEWRYADWTDFEAHAKKFGFARQVQK